MLSGAKYKITSKIITSEKGKVRVWGIIGYEITHDNKMIKLHLDDISDNYEFTENLVNILNCNDVSLVHLQDIVEDFLLTY